MPLTNAARRAADIAPIIPRPPADVAPLRDAFTEMVASQWRRHLGTLNSPPSKARVIAEMYARACYSMLLVSADAPALLHLPIALASRLPLSRELTIRLARGLLSSLPRFAPQKVNRQLLLTSALMGMLDIVLDECASLGEPEVLRVASMLTLNAPSPSEPARQQLVTLTHLARRNESAWQSAYWDRVLTPAIHRYCLAEALAMTHAPDPTGMAHRSAGIDCAIKGMWYVIAPVVGWVDETAWNQEQRWMADTSLLMQMIDDWVDQDEDRGKRVTPVLTGEWSLACVDKLYCKTTLDQATMLAKNGIRGTVAQELFLDLYNDYLHVALQAMSTGAAA